MHTTCINTTLLKIIIIIAVIELGLRSTALVGHPSPVLVAVVMLRPTLLRSTMAPCKLTIASS